jgi:hypothetical protein
MAMATGNITFNPAQMAKLKSAGITTANTPASPSPTKDAYSGSVDNNSAGLMPKPSGWAGGSYGLQGAPAGAQYVGVSDAELQKRIQQGALDQQRGYKEALTGIVQVPGKDWIKESQPKVNEGVAQWIGAESKREPAFAQNLKSGLSKPPAARNGAEKEAVDRFEDQQQAIQVRTWSGQIADAGITGPKAQMVHNGAYKVEMGVAEQQGAGRELWERKH